METLATIGLAVLGTIVLIGIIRIILNPYTGLLDLILDLFCLDLLGDALGWIIEALADSLDD